MTSLAVSDSHWSGLSAFLPWDNSNLGMCPDPSSPCKGSTSETDHVLFFFMTYTRQFQSEYSHGHSINHSVIYTKQ